jgi:hypothetical protein
MTALVVVSPWFAWVYHVSGTLLPSSGQAQAAIPTAAMIPARAAVMGAALVQQLSPWSYTGARPGLTAVTTVAWLLAAVVAVSRRHGALHVVAPGCARVVVAWGAGLAALVPLYTAFFWASHFYARYTAPLCVLTYPLTGLVLARLTAGHDTVRIGRWVYAAMLACFAVWALASLHTGNIGNTHVLSAGFIGHHFSARRVGAFQSGVIGYFHDGTVNLDGKVNGAALRASKAGRLGEYVDDVRIDVLIDWPEVLRSNLDGAYLRAKWVECPIQPPLGRSLCLTRRPATR